MSLRVLIGPSPRELRPVSPALDGRVSCPVESRLFRGNVTVFLNQPGVPASQTAASARAPERAFTIQMDGTFPSPRPPGCATFDDVLLSIELDRPVEWSQVPAPAWMVQLLWKWTRRLSSQVRITNLFSGAPPNLLGPENSADADVGAGLSRGRLFGDAQPAIQLPLVSAASTMNVYSNSASGSIGPAPSVHDVSWKELAHSRGTSLPVGQQQQQQLDFTVNLRQREFHAIHEPHQVWAGYRHMVHQFPRELVEFNRFLLVSQSQFSPPQSMAPSERRNYLRQNYTAVDYRHERFVRKHHAGMGGWQTAAEPPSTIVESPRDKYLFHPSLRYAFELYADYFDFNVRGLEVLLMQL